MADDRIESYLGDWARWHRASVAERRKLWHAPAVPWARDASTNYMTAEDDSEALDDVRHGDQMRRVDAAVDDLDYPYRCAVYQACGLGSWASVKWSEDMLPIIYRTALVRLQPLLEKRGLIV